MHWLRDINVHIKTIVIAGAVLNNSLVSKPLLSAEGDLTTYHYGIIKESTMPVAELSPLERHPHDVTYLLKPQLLEEILSTIHQKSLFDGFVSSYSYN